MSDKRDRRPPAAPELQLVLGRHEPPAPTSLPVLLDAPFPMSREQARAQAARPTRH